MASPDCDDLRLREYRERAESERQHQVLRDVSLQHLTPMRHCGTTPAGRLKCGT